MNEITREWLECFRKDKAEGKEIASSIFWRLALDVLPEGVDRAHPEVVAALEEIRVAVDERRRIPQ